MNTQNSIPFNVYPVASEKGEPIPLTVLKPIATRIVPIGATPIALPEKLADGANLILVYSTAPFTVTDAETQPDLEGWAVNAITCQAATEYYLIVSNGFVVTSTAEVSLTLLVKWAQMANLGKYRSL